MDQGALWVRYGLVALTLWLGLIGGSGCHSLQLTRLSVTEVPPAGVQIVFRVLRDDGEPVERLRNEDFEVINNELSRAFGSEGGGVPTLGRPTDYAFYTILVLDMSDSIFLNDAVDEVIAGAEVFVRTMVEQQPTDMKQHVAIFAFGSTVQSEQWCDFTTDHGRLYDHLRRLRDAGSRGGTNLYGAYISSLDLVENERSHARGLVTRSLVLLTDGTHEAGNTAGLRADALRRLEASEVDVYTIGIRGDYDELAIRELASSPRTNFYIVREADLLTGTFSDISARVQAIANSNYVFGICSPVETGSPSVTIEASLGFMSGSMNAPYSTRGVEWTGDVSGCDPEFVATAVVTGTTDARPRNSVDESDGDSDETYSSPQSPEMGPVGEESSAQDATSAGGELSPLEINTALRAERTAFRRCFDPYDTSSVTLSIHIRADGTVGYATALSGGGDPAVAFCLTRVVSSDVIFPGPGSPIYITHTFSRSGP